MILDNLRRAGVQNTKRDERLELSRLDPYPGVYVQGVGEYTESGKARTAAVVIGPEFGTVGPELVRDAAKEALKVADLLVGQNGHVGSIRVDGFVGVTRL
jgi:adenine-specific DNA-methyltransferase